MYSALSYLRKQIKDTQCSQIGRLSIIKVLILPKLICRFSAVLIKIPAGFFPEIDKVILKSMWKYEGPRVARTIFKGQKKVGRLIVPIS